MNRSDSFDGIAVETIVDHALDIIVSGGLAELTLRPLAQRVGVSVAVISARMGAKVELIERVVTEASTRDKAFFERWLGLASSLHDMDRTARAALADLAFRDWLKQGRERVFLLIELVHDGALHAEPSSALDEWLGNAGVFWSTLLFGGPELADLSMGFVLDEAGFALGAGDNHSYSLLRVLCLQRLVGGVLAPVSVTGQEAGIPRLIALLEPTHPSVVVTDDDKRQRIADSAAQIIVSQGMEAVTHRSVALAASVPASTVVYHFGARAALVVAGLHSVIARFHSSLNDAKRKNASPSDADSSTRDLVKATSMIALASAREPSLVPYALDMRRRRGENIRAQDAAILGFETGTNFDRASAQVVSIALFGMQMVAMARKLPEQAICQQAFKAFAQWRASRAG